MVAQLRKNMQRRRQLKVYVLKQGTQHVEGVKAGNDKDFSYDRFVSHRQGRVTALCELRFGSMANCKQTTTNFSVMDGHETSLYVFQPTGNVFEFFITIFMTAQQGSTTLQGIYRINCEKYGRYYHDLQN